MNLVHFSFAIAVTAILSTVSSTAAEPTRAHAIGKERPGNLARVGTSRSIDRGGYTWLRKVHADTVRSPGGRARTQQPGLRAHSPSVAVAGSGPAKRRKRINASKNEVSIETLELRRGKPPRTKKRLVPGTRRKS